MTTPFLKICGITRLEDAQGAIQWGATALGFVLWPESPRRVAVATVAAIVAQLPSSVLTVGVFVNESSDEVARVMTETKLTAVQLHGDETLLYAASLPWPILRSVTLETVDSVTATWPSSTTLLLDAADPERRGGTGRRVDWTRAAAIARTRRVVLAGGLTPENVAAGIVAVRPYGVDVSSGVEDAPGVKNAKKVAQFLTIARKAMSDWNLVLEQ
jgi:phosphoribosylanthranilate isomerase